MSTEQRLQDGVCMEWIMENEPEFEGSYKTVEEAVESAEPGWYVCEAPGGGYSTFPPGTPPHSIYPAGSSTIVKWPGTDGHHVPDFEEGFEIATSACDLRVIEYSEEHIHVLDPESKTERCYLGRNWNRCTAEVVDFAKYPQAGDEVSIGPGEKTGTRYYDGNEWRWLNGNYEVRGDGTLDCEFVSQSEIAEWLSEYRAVGIENFCCQFES